mgnify:FL=1
MNNNQDIKNFIEKYPEEFNELVYIFKKLRFDSDNSNNTSEEKDLNETINILKEEFKLDDFVKELITKVSLKELLAIIKNTIKSKKEKINNSLKKDSKSLDGIESEFNNLLKDGLSSLRPICTPENEYAISSRSLPNVKTTRNKGQSYDY